MTPEQLDAIQARVDAATEGPWRVEHDNADDYEAGINYGDYPYALHGPKNASLTTEQLERPFLQDYKNRVSEMSEMTDADAEFIAHARTDVPALLALVRSQQAQIERVEAAIRDCSFDYDFDAPTVVDVEAIRAALTATEGA
ncbi:hypothetical protein ABC337_15295 [Arthrobacter sp. 1P04PC]|uniref:hypothetical protein n=2 Tax=unclassified Arthrobacter TaxID=235627 RepID=UPI00399FDA13